MREIFTSCISHWTDNQAAALDGRNPEGVHQLRVGLRRFRSAVTVFKYLLPEAQARWLRDEGRWAIRETGPARDWDVFIDELLAPVIEAHPEDTDLVTLRKRAEAKRAAGYARAHAVLRSKRYSRFMLELNAWLVTRGWQDGLGAEQRADLSRPIAAYAARLLAKRRQRALKRGKGFAQLTPDQRHKVRVALKKLRYASEFFQTLFPDKQVARYRRTLRKMQDDLGHLNDVRTAERLLGEICPGDADPGLTRARGLVIDWYARSGKDHEIAALRDWKAFRDATVFWRKTS